MPNAIKAIFLPPLESEDFFVFLCKLIEAIANKLDKTPNRIIAIE